jgi:DnaJ homologue, subfamily C, member 28, conserved domain
MTNPQTTDRESFFAICHLSLLCLMPSPIEKLIDEWVSQNSEEHLPGKGKPLDLEEYFRWPEDKRMGYSLIREAGCVPPEVALLQEVDSLNQSIDRCTDPEKRRRLRDRLQARQVEFNIHLEERHRWRRPSQ